MRIVQDNRKLFFFFFFFLTKHDFEKNLSFEKKNRVSLFYFLNLSLKKIEVYWKKKPWVLKKVFSVKQNRFYKGKNWK